MSTSGYFWTCHPSLLTYPSSRISSGNDSSHLVSKTRNLRANLESYSHNPYMHSLHHAQAGCYLFINVWIHSSLSPSPLLLLWFWPIFARLFHSFLTASIFQTKLKIIPRMNTLNANLIMLSFCNMFNVLYL